MWSYIISIAVVVLLIAIFILTYVWNEKTEKPEDCEDLECAGCKAANCSNRKEL